MQAQISILILMPERAHSLLDLSSSLGSALCRDRFMGCPRKGTLFSSPPRHISEMFSSPECVEATCKEK